MRQEAEAEADSVIKGHSVVGLPVDPIAIARAEGIEVSAKESDKPGASGFLVRCGNAFAICYATHISNEGFIRFTVAHELGHYFLPGHPEKLLPKADSVLRCRSDFTESAPLERQADAFASALLMPELFFMAALRESGEGFAAVERLAATCKTSITATAIRYARFTEEAVAVIISKGKRVECCFMSDALPAGLKGVRLEKGSLVPPSSSTGKFNSDPRRVRDCDREEGSAELDLWFDGACPIPMNEDVVGLGSYEKTLTVLFPNEAVDFEEECDG
jgi:hypothetical protein